MAKLCLKNATLVFCSASSAGKWNILNSGAFPLVLIDEAAQLVEAEAILPLQVDGIRRVVMVGDQQQLAATVFSQVGRVGPFGHIVSSSTYMYICHII